MLIPARRAAGSEEDGSVMWTGNPFSCKGVFEHSHLFALWRGRGVNSILKVQRTIDLY